MVVGDPFPHAWVVDPAEMVNKRFNELPVEVPGATVLPPAVLEPVVGRAVVEAVVESVGFKQH